MNEPYEDDPDNTGIIIFSQEDLDELFELFDQNQMQAAVHCIGDRAMDMVIKAIKNSSYRKSNVKGRHGIVHCQITNPRILKEMAEAGYSGVYPAGFCGSGYEYSRTCHWCTAYEGNLCMENHAGSGNSYFWWI